MLARPTLTKPVQDDASKPKTQARFTEERYGADDELADDKYTDQGSKRTSR